MGAAAVPQILITIAARFGRISWKYSSIAYALILKDVGVLMQTLYLMATDMGLGGCAIGTTNIDLFAKMTGIEFHVEGPVGQFAIGRGAKSAASNSQSDRSDAGRYRQRICGCGFTNSSDWLFGSEAIAGGSALEISDSFAAPLSRQREHGALRVRASDDPLPPGTSTGPSRILPPPAFTRSAAASIVADVEVVEPERDRHHRQAW